MNKNYNEIRQFVIPYLLLEHKIKVEKSLKNKFNWFVPSPMDELPENVDDMSDEAFQDTCGTHLQSDAELLNFACELGYITDEEVFGE